MGKIKNLLIEAMETPIMDACSECRGSGMVEVDVVFLPVWVVMLG